MRRITHVITTLRKVYLTRSFILIAGLLSLTSISQAQNVITTLATRSKCPGDTVWVSIYVQNLTNCSAGSLEFTFNTNVLTPVLYQYSPPPAAPTIQYREKNPQITGMWLANAHNDTVTIGFFNLTTPINIASGLICQLLFTVNNNNGFSPLTWNLGVDSAACMYSDFNDPFGPPLPATWVNGNVHTSPSLSAQASNLSLIPGGTGSFTVTALEATAFQWQVSTDGGLTFNNVPAGEPYTGETTNSLTITNATISMNGYKYRCLITGNCPPPYNTMYSNVLTLTVSIPCPTAFAVTGGGYYCPGGEGAVVGLSNSEIGVFYQLKRNGVAVGSPVAGTGSALSFGPQTIFTSPSTFTAEGTNTCGTTQMTGNAIVTLYGVPIGILNPPNPNPTICAGQGTYFYIQLSGPAGYLPCTVTYKDETNNLYPSVVLNNSNNQVQIFPTATHTYSLYSIVDNHGCNATNMSGSATINVNPAPNPTIGSNSPICEGQDLLLNAYAAGSVTYSWSHTPTSWTSTEPNPIRPNAQANYAGTYYCVVTNTSNSCSKSVTTQVVVNPPLPDQAGSITGPDHVCKGQTGVVYSVGTINNATNYVWSVPSGFTIMSGSGTNSITVNVGLNAITDNVSVAGNNGCGTGLSSSLLVFTHDIPTVAWTTALTQQCVSSTSYTLTGGTPAGGTYSGAGVTGNIFNAAVAGVGPHVLTYSYSDAYGCSGSVTNTIVVNGLPVVTWNYTLTGQCITSTFYPLTGTSPSGGTYSGPGVSAGIFNASVAGVGTHTLTYTFIDGNGCSAFITNTISVYALPVVTWTNALTPQCENSTTYTLTGGTPPGGTYSGLGVTGNNFNASVAGVGVKTLTYTYTNGFGCTNTASNTITVNALPTVGWPNTLTPQCITNTTYELTGGSPAGGNYGGIGVTGTNFNASVAGTGLKTLTYTYSNVSGCSNTANNTILVYDLPLANAGDDQTLNIGQSTTLNGSASGGTGDYSYSWTPADFLVNSLVQNPTTIALNTTTVFTLVVTDNISGCQSLGDNVTITVSNLPLTLNVTAFPSQICENGFSTLSAGASGGSGTYTYNWASDPEGFTSILPSPVVNPAVTTTYNVTVSDGIETVNGSVTVNVTALPIGYFVAGGGAYCAGGEGLMITLSGSQEGFNYILNHNGAFLTSVVGTGSELTFGPYTAVGDYTVLASIPVIGCITAMEGIATISVNPNPAVFTGIAGDPLCNELNFIPVSLSGSELGVNYQLFVNGAMVIEVSGTGGPLFLANVNESGVYTCVATHETTSCVSDMLMDLNLTYYPPLQLFVVDGGGTFCIGGQADITLSGSETGAVYTLYHNGIALGNTLAGTGEPLVWGALTTGGIYTVSALQLSTNCVTFMSGQAEIIVNNLPVANAGPDQNIPYGTAATLQGSATGGDAEFMSYAWEPASLLLDPTAQNPTTVNLTEPADFTLIVTNTQTSCVSTADQVHIGITGGPLAISVSGEPSVICEGGSATISVAIENGSGEYTVSWTSLPEGFTSSQTTIVVNPTVTTTYYVEVNDGVSTLYGDFTVTVNPLPTVYQFTGGGSACAGTEGFNLYLSSSQLGAIYNLYLDGSLFDGPFAGTGEAMTFGLYDASGIYTLGADLNGCQAFMDGTPTISIYPVPVVTSNPANLSLPEGGSGQFAVAASFTTLYQWQMSTDGVSFNDIFDGGNYSGTNTAQLQVIDATLAMDGYHYRCFLSNENCSLYSGSALLNVYPYVSEITVSLGDYTVCPGELIIPIHVTNMNNVASVSLSFTFNPSVLTYVNYTNINPAISDPYLISINAVGGNLVFSHFTLIPYSIADGNLVDLIFNYTGGNSALAWNFSAPENNQFTNLNGDILSTIFVGGSVTQLSVPAVIETQPADAVVDDGGSTSFHIVATGASGYQWQVFDGITWTDIVDNGLYSGASTADLTVSGVTLAMNGYLYACVVSEDLCGFETFSSSALLTVNPVSTQITTTIGSATACPESLITIPITVDQLLNVSAISLTLGWDPGVLTYVNTTDFNPAFSNPSEIIVNAGDGYWAMSWYNVVPLNIVNGTLADLVFTYHGNSTDLEWDLATVGNCEYDDPDGNVLAATFINGAVDSYLTPEIITQPVDVTIYDGSNASFTVDALNVLTYQWFVSDDNGTTWTGLSDGGAYSGTNTAILQISAADISFNGNLYHCVLTSDMCQVTTDDAELIVLPVVQGINTTAGTVYACPNTQVIVPIYAEYLYNVSAISLFMNFDPSVLTYAGYQNINPVFNPPYDGMIINSNPGNWALSWYNVTPINLSAGNLIELIFNYNGGSTNLVWDLVSQGYCEYDDADGNILPSSFFNGFVGPAGDNPVIVQQPAGANISDLGDASFNVVATGASTYQWQESPDGGATWNDILDGGIYSGATTQTLNLTVVPISMDDYLYRVVITGGNCTVISNQALLNVVPLGGIIETSLTDLLACPGDQIVIPVNVQYLYNIAALSLTLNYDAGVLSFVGTQNPNTQLADGVLNEFQFDGEWRMSWFSIVPINIGTGTLIELVFNYNGGYTDLTWDLFTPGNCEYNDFDGNILLANFTNGSVGPNGIIPTFTSSPADVTVPHHGNATFNVTATDATAYQWQVSTNGGTTWNNLVDNLIYSGVTTPDLNITNAIYLYNGYLYRCMVTGEICSIPSDAALLTVTPIDFVIVTTAVSAAECPGNDIVVPVTVNDFYNVASISLALNYEESILQYVNYQNVNPGVADALLNPGTGVFMFSWYSVTPLSLGDATLFELVFHYNGGVGNMNWDLVTQGYCEYTNFDGNTMASVFVDGTITSAEIIPSIVSNPVETGGFVGDPASFTASASNAVSLQWQVSLDGGLSWVDVVDDGNITGSNTETLYIAHLQLEMNGYLYRLVANGTCNHVAITEAALLTVILQPTIVTTAGTAVQCAGDIVIPVSATNFMNVASMALALNFDNTLFSFAGYQNVDAGFADGVITFNAAGNQVLINYNTLIPTTIADGNLFELIFNSAGGTTNLSWDITTPGACEYQTIQGYVIPSAFVDGAVTAIELPTYTYTLSDNVICSGDSITFTEQFTGLAPWTVQYLGNGVPGSFTVNEALSYFTDAYYATTVYEPLTVTDGNGCTNVINHIETITVNPLPTYTYEVSSHEICLGESVTYTNYFTGTAPWTVDFLYNGTPSSFTTSDNPEYYTEALSETTTFQPLTVTDGNGCTNVVDQTETIIVHPITSIVTSPANVAMDEGSSTTFHVEALNALSYQWQISTDNGTTWADLVEGADYTGVNTADLTVTLVNYFMNGNQFRCIVGGYCPVSVASDAATLTVYPVITTIAGTVEQCAGDIVVPISVLHMYGMAAMSLSLNYDNTVLTYVGYQDVNTEFGSGFLAIDATNSQVKMGYFSITPANVGDGLLFNILFTSTGGYTDLIWDTQTPGNCEYQNLAGNNITSIYINGSVTVNPLPSVNATVDPGTICYGQSSVITYELTGTAPWTIEITSVSAAGTTVTNEVANASPYLLTVTPEGTTTYTVTSLTDANGCISTENVPVLVIVNELPTYTYEASTHVICAGDSVTFISYFTGLAPWTVEYLLNGVPSSFTTSDNPSSYTRPFDETTVYQPFSVTDGNGCTNVVDQTETITVNPLPVVTLDPAGPVCLNADPIVLNGLPAGGVYTGTGVTGNIFDPAAAGVGSWIVTYTYTNENNCVNSASQTIIVNELPIVYPVLGGGAYCAGGAGLIVGMGGSEIGIQYTLYKDDVYTGQMIVGDGSLINFGNQVMAGVYTVLATNPVTGCENWMGGTAVVIVNPVPNVYAGGYSIICQGTSTTINAVVMGGVGPYNFQWSPATGLDNPTILNPVASPNGTTFYTLVVTDMNGCTDSDQALIVVNAKPVVNAGVDKTIVSGGSVAMTATVSGGLPPYTYLWTPATGLSNPTALNPVASPLVTTTYTLQVTDSRGCVSTDEVVINVTDVPFGYDVTGFVTYDNAVSTPLNNTTVTLSSGATVVNTTLTTSNGEYVFSPVANGNYTTNGSSTKPWGGGNSLDALLISRHFVNLQPLAGLRLQAADCDGNGVVNAADGLLVMMRSVLMISSFPAGDWIFETKAITVNNGTVINNFMGLCFGDVNGSYIPAAKAGPMVTLDVQGSQAVLTNESFTLPIQAGRNMNVGAVSLVLDIPAGLDITTVKPADALKAANFVYNIIEGKLYIEWFTLSALDISQGETLFTMTCSTNVDANSNEFVFAIDGQSVMGDPNARIIDGAVISIPKVTIVESAFNLGNNYPNPFNLTTEISYTLPEAGNVNLVVYDVMGNKVAEVINEDQNAGIYHITFDGTNLTQGIYFYRMIVNGISNKHEAVNRMIISR
jgi:hypothetical protein